MHKVNKNALEIGEHTVNEVNEDLKGQEKKVCFKTYLLVSFSYPDKQDFYVYSWFSVYVNLESILFV